MFSSSMNHKFLALVLGCLVMVKSSSPDLVKSPIENAETHKETCKDLSCEDNVNNIESPRDVLHDVKNLDPTLENERAAHSSKSDEQVSVPSDENPIQQKHSDDITPGSDQFVEDKNTFPDILPSDFKNSIETTDSIETMDTDYTESVIESNISDTQGLTNSNSQNEHDAPSLEVIGMEASDINNEASTLGTKSEPAKHTLFPFLYTSLFSMVKSLLRSFLSELVDQGNQQVVTANATEGTNQSSTISEEENSNNLNVTSNGTDSLKRTRFQCAIKNVTSNDIGKVKVVNSTELLDILSLSKSQKSSACVLVMFYAPWCHFCAQTAPHYNALARAFPQLDVLAVDTSHFSYLNARFGTVAVPNIMLFHSRSAVRFNHTQRILEKFSHFVTNNTGLEPQSFVLLEPLDFVGPLPCVVKQGRDWLLWLAWVFVAFCTSYGFVQSQYGQGFIARLKFLWQEHQHID